MTTITRARVRVSEGSAPPPPREPTVIEVSANGFAGVTRTLRDANGPVTGVPVAMEYKGDNKDTQVLVPKTSDDQGRIKISIIAGSQPTSFVFSLTVQGSEPILFRVIVK